MDKPVVRPRFPIALLLAPPIVSIVAVTLIKLVVSGDGMRMEGPAALIMLAMVFALWLGPFVALYALSKSMLILYRDPERSTHSGFAAVAACTVYLVSFAGWLVWR